MASRCELSAEAQEDLVAIWQTMAMDSVALVNRIETSFTSCLYLWPACRGTLEPIIGS
jgi:hypothetical protein